MRTFMAALAVVLVSTACGSSPPASDDGPLTIRLGYFPNLTHAPALVGLQNGLLAVQLGGRVTIQPNTVNARGCVGTGTFDRSDDASLASTITTLNALVQSSRQAIH